MNFLLFCVAVMIALLAWVLNTQLEPSVYACSEVTQKDPIEVQKLCESARKGKWWMK
jgi:hypothetical protein